MSDGATITPATIQENLSYLYERRNSNTSFTQPPTCYGGRKALQWTGSAWNCYTVPSEVTYSWVRGNWSACSKSCGGGTQTRTVTCRGSDGRNYGAAYCTGTKPATRRACNTQACRCTYYYRPADSRWNENVWLQNKTDMGATYRAAMQVKTAAARVKIRFGTYAFTKTKQCNANGNWVMVSGSNCAYAQTYSQAYYTYRGYTRNANLWAPRGRGAWRADYGYGGAYFCR